MDEILNDLNASWRGFWNLCPKAISVVKIILLIVMLDIAVLIIASFVLSDECYFTKYLGDTSAVPEVYYEETIDAYYQHVKDIKPNKEVGWIKTPNFKKKEVEWEWNTDVISAVIPSKQEGGSNHSNGLDGNNVFD